MNVEMILRNKGSAVFTVSADLSLSHAVQSLSEKNVGALIVVDTTEAVIGILSERDAVRHVGREGPGALDKPVSTFMTARPISCTPETRIDEVMATMTARRIRHMPVMADGTLLGVISIGDVVKVKIDEIENEAAALREYIAS